MVSPSSTAAALDALRTARRVTFSAYFVHPGRVVSALEDAAKRGASVAVRVDGDLWHMPDRVTGDNRDAVAQLKKAHVDAKALHRHGNDPGFHIKAAVCDRVAYLDDCNWNSADTVIRDDNPAHVRAIRRAVLGGGPARAGSLALRKDVALKGEAKVIAHAAREADVETETLGASVVSGALRRLAKAGVHCRLLVSQWCADDDLGRKRIASLEKDGVQVRAVKSGEKLAVAGNRAWAGSANATSSFKKCNYIDWGLSTRDPRIVRDLHARFTEHWNEATPVEP